MNIQKKLSGRFTITKVIFLFMRLCLTPSDKKLQLIKNKYKEKRCFIVGLGPSLAIDDLNKLYNNKEICFSMNRVFQLFKKTEWRPDYYHISDTYVYTDEVKEAMKNIEKEGKSHILYSKWNIPWASSNSIYLKTNSIRKVLQNSKSDFLSSLNLKYKFSTNAERFIYDGESGVHNLIQIAYYMGFKEVYLLGVDCGMSGIREYAVGLKEQKISNYSNGVGDLLIRDFNDLNEDIKKKNLDFHIYNAGRGGRLEVFPRVVFDDLFD